MVQKEHEIVSLNAISAFFGTKKFSKGAILLRQGEKSQYGYQVLSGCLRSFVIDTAGKEHIIQFAPENWLLTDMNAFLNNSSAVMNIDVIEESEVIVYDKRVFSYLEQASKEVLLAEIKRFQNNIIAHNNRIIALLSATAEERYISFMETYPSLHQRLPLKLIAAYLGITPEFLSRIRKKLVKK
ncbi:Crp/Fnr family transcriptional regulator [Parapedobacter koreensis]|uniref:cAMP-binding domain of CRP or a regulatory subunit of cAMP-dependent protein kinases n=1 Tax=Parapedobacter koreensis TaxID=332977 RepID=A0A1H7LUV7_9SPHI|nr:Crp/Fnr family transcriptional regulator [Parapedobacter koreensis]SEL02295.1 cAMP-binding domain of CRP or a regulatory subunit of cAMP-dependent protein kinases [Parapedobacter koreensis]